MHELSIALSILDVVAEEAERQEGRVVAVHLKLGPLAGVVRDALVSAFEMARGESPFPDAELVVEEVPVAVHCPRCGVERTPPSPYELRCPVCSTPTPSVVRGRELEVVALEIQP